MKRLVIRKKTNPDSVKQKENESFLFSKEFERNPFIQERLKVIDTKFLPKTVVTFLCGDL